MLRVWGHNLDVVRLLDATGLDPEHDVSKVYRRGEPCFPKSRLDGPHNETSGINICVSDAAMDEFDQQVEDAIEMLNEDAELVRALVAFEGVEEVLLDFGILRRDVVVQCDHLPAELIRLAGSLGCAIELSQYPSGKQEEATTEAAG